MRRSLSIMLVGLVAAAFGVAAQPARPDPARPDPARPDPIRPDPTALPGVVLYLESTAGLQVARCASEDCFAAGAAAPLESQYCDVQLNPEGCVRRWLDLSASDGDRESVGGGREVGQSDADKPGFVTDCLGGRPCVRVRPGSLRSQTLEIEGGLAIDGSFSLFLLVRPEAQRGDFFYFGHSGTELVHRSASNALELRLGVSRPVAVTEPGAVAPGRWQLIELHRDSRSALRGLVDGWDRTPGRPVATGRLALRHLLSIGRARAMAGDVAAVAVFDGRLRERQAQDVRGHLAQVYGLDFGDGSPPPRRPGAVELQRRLWLDWSFDRIDDCRAAARTELAAVLGPDCPRSAPRRAPGIIGGGLLFDGDDDEVRSEGPLGPMDQLYSFTAAGWIKTTSRGGWQTVLDKRDGLDDGWDLYLDPEGRGFLRVDDETLEGESLVADGEWHHLAGVFDGERLLLYVDGRLDRIRYLGRRAPIETTREVAAGRNFAGRRDAFKGMLDELRIYGRALDPQEISALAVR